MSPFFRADKIAGALLMYHAWEDQNTGTSPISSTRMMASLQGLGRPAALYMYRCVAQQSTQSRKLRAVSSEP